MFFTIMNSNKIEHIKIKFAVFKSIQFHYDILQKKKKKKNYSPCVSVVVTQTFYF
jgi:hypothetical protein